MGDRSEEGVASGLPLEVALGAEADAAIDGLVLALLGARDRLEAPARAPTVVACADLSRAEVNVLSALGNSFSEAVRRRLLLACLEAASWNMTAVSSALRLGGACNVARVMKDLGLGDLLAKARRSGLVRRGGRRVGAGRPKKDKG